MADDMGKTALVTGASRGIGRAIAIRLAQAKFDVVVNYLFEEEDYAGVVKEIEALGQKAIAIKADVSDFAQVEGMIDKTVEQMGSIDVLVNNAGITKDNLLMRMKEQDFDSVININLKSVFNCSKCAIKYMVKQRSGCIVSMSSIVGENGSPGQTNYSASKAGIIGFTKSLAKEVGSRGIRVNAIAPGFVATNMTEVLSENLKEAMLNTVPLKRPGTPEDIANAVAFLVSKDASYITGHVLNVNGGMA